MHGVLPRIVEASRDETGAAALEYGLLVALIAIAVLSAVAAFGDGVRQTFCAAASALGFPASC